MIGSSCLKYKTCRICGQTKQYQQFVSKGRGKRRSYCKRCKGEKWEEKNPFTKYTFDTSVLKKADIKVRSRVTLKKRIYYKISYEQAVLMVSEGVAGIKDETQIHLIYDWQSFRKMILNRDKGICAYCGNYGDTIDHILPKSKGGLSVFSNCICSCIDCNKTKGNLSVVDFLNSYNIISGNGNIQNETLKKQLVMVRLTEAT